MLSFIFYVIIKRKRGFCCKPAVDFIKFFKLSSFTAVRAILFSFLLRISLHFSELKAQDGAPHWWLAFAPGFFVRALWCGSGRILGARAMRVLLEKIGRTGLMENSGRLLRRRPVHKLTTLSR